jgi:TolB-like protein/Tfp pilus assembly protein PilF
MGAPILLLVISIVTAALRPMRPGTSEQVDIAGTSAGQRQVSLAVLPFKNRSGESEQEYFADAVTADLTDGLSRLPIKVIAHSTALTYKEKLIDVRQVGRELNVRYVVDGTVQRSGDDVRVSARLIDASTAANLQTEIIHLDRRDLHRLGDDVAARLAHFFTLELQYAQGDRSIRERRHDPDAVDFLMRANALLARTPGGRDVSEPRRLFREALQRDDTLVYAWIGLAMTYIRLVRFSPTYEQDILEASAAAERAMALDPSSAWSHLAIGWVLLETKRADKALVAFEHAAQLNGNLPLAHASVAGAHIMLGKPENALEPLRKAMRLSPRDPDLPMWQMIAGVAALHLQQNDEAIDWLTKSVTLNPSNPFSRMFLASALALTGRQDEAKAEVAELLRLNPKFTIGRFKAVDPSDLPAFKMQREQIYEGLRRAGAPE